MLHAPYNDLTPQCRYPPFNKEFSCNTGSRRLESCVASGLCGIFSLRHFPTSCAQPQGAALHGRFRHVGTRPRAHDYRSRGQSFAGGECRLGIAPDLQHDAACWSRPPLSSGSTLSSSPTWASGKSPPRPSATWSSSWRTAAAWSGALREGDHTFPGFARGRADAAGGHSPGGLPRLRQAACGSLSSAPAPTSCSKGSRGMP